MKRTIAKFGMTMAMLLSFLPVFADNINVGKLYYSILSEEDGTVEVTKTPHSSGDIEIPNEINYNNRIYTVTSIGEYAFYCCSSLTSITIPNSVTSIGEYAFSGCSSLTSITIPNSVTSIGYSAFYRCSSLTSITIPNSVTSIGKYAFSSCSGLTTISIPNSVTSIGYSAFSSCSGLTTISIPNSVTSIGNYAFDGCSSLTSITIPNSVTSIGNSAFSSCSSLTSITIPNSVTSIGKYAFSDCSSLNTVTFGTGLLEVAQNAFSDRNIKKAFWLGNTPPTNASNVGAAVNYVANNQYNLGNQKVYQFLSSMFTVDGTVYVPVSPSERTCDVVDCLYDKDYTKAVISDKVINRGIEMKVLEINPYSYYRNDFIKELSVSHSGNIGDYAFKYCENLQKATIKNVGSIGNDAFEDCSKLENLEIGTTVTEIGTYAFRDCSSVPYVAIPNSVKTLGSSAFYNCKALESVSIGTGISKLATSVFSGCSSLSSLVIPNNIVSIENYAFSGCTSLADVRIENSADDTESILKLESNGSSPLFSSCPLDEVYIGRKLSYSTSSSYGYSPFYRNIYLRTVEITDAETEIYNNEFYGCTNLQSLKIGNGVTKIGSWAFSGCSAMDYFSAGYKVETIGEEAFSDCTGLKKYYSLSANPPVCGDQALDDINKWDCTLYIPDGSIKSYQEAPQWKDFFFIDKLDPAGIEMIVEEDTPFDIFNLNGVAVKRGASKIDIENLPSGIYIINGKKVAVK